MEKLLIKLAEQLDGIDEASLLELWPKYAQLTYEFQGTKSWETAALVFCLIQAKHMKNQLFNYHWEQQAMQSGTPQPSSPQMQQPPATHHKKKPCRILQFSPIGQSEDEGK